MIIALIPLRSPTGGHKRPHASIYASAASYLSFTWQSSASSNPRPALWFVS